MPWLIPIAVLMHCENGAFDAKTRHHIKRVTWKSFWHPGAQNSGNVRDILKEIWPNLPETTCILQALCQNEINCIIWGILYQEKIKWEGRFISADKIASSIDKISVYVPFVGKVSFVRNSWIIVLNRITGHEIEFFETTDKDIKECCGHCHDGAH